MATREQLHKEVDALEDEQVPRAEIVVAPEAQAEGEQPPLTCIGAFSSGRGDLSKLAAEDVFEPEPSR
jgi:hypothetical protein